MGLIQKWEGVVLEVSKDTFVADLATIEGGEDDMIAEIYLRNIHKDDLVLVEPGAIFYWSIDEGGTSIRFRRLPPWTQHQLDKARSISAAAKGH